MSHHSDAPPDGPTPGLPAHGDHLLTERDSNLLIISLNRPASLNALTTAMMLDLGSVLDTAEADPEVRCIMLTGVGRAFCSGASTAGGADGFFVADDMRDAYNPVARRLLEMTTPTVAAIKGHTVGAGASLAILCDFRIAAEDLKLAFLFVRIGLGIDMGASYRLPRIVGHAKATELAMLGDTLGAAEATEIGLVTRVVPSAELEAQARAFASRLAEGPVALGLIKGQLEAAWQNTVVEQLQLELEVQTAAAATFDFTEGITAAQARRTPDFLGR